jgi:TolB protein
VSNAGGGPDIWVMNADGGDMRQVTNTNDIDAEPGWSPAGDTIAFHRTGSGITDILLVPASGGTPKRLSRAGDERMPAWSPDGRLIAFADFPAGGGSPQLYTMRPDGSDVQLRTTEYTWNGGEHPAWIRSP